MPLKNKELAKELLENQQQEIRAYDQKAGYYIASNSGLFVVALFTLCIFTMFHNNHDDIAHFDYRWWILLSLTVLYVLGFLFSSLCCLCVLFARVNKKDCGIQSITNPFSVDINNLDGELSKTEENIDNVREYHIKANVKILRKKHFWANCIPPASIAMGGLFLTLIVFLFVF